MALALIDKQDNFEIVRDQIAALLKTELVNQQTLATAAGRDPTLWDLRIFVERFLPFEEYLNQQTDFRQIINVWYDSTSFDKSASNVSERQKGTFIFNLDCYGHAASEDNVSGGHLPADREASLKMQRGVRLVRNILMASENRYLGLRGVVWKRWVSSIRVFQPTLDGQQVQQVAASRISLEVDANELAPQIEFETLGSLLLSFEKDDSGEILISADYPYEQ